MQSKNLIPVSIQRSATTFGLSTDLLARLPLLLILWSTCWLLTGCGFPPSLTSGPLLQSEPLIQATIVNSHDLTVESHDETFEQFFIQRHATPIWHWLSDQVDYTQVVDPSIIHTDPTIREILSKYGPEEQAELKVGIKTYIQHRNHETVFRDFLFAHELDEIWERLNQAKGEDTLDLTGMLQACDPAVQTHILQDMVHFIGNHVPDLTVLDLSANRLTTLPDSFVKLINLHTLYLEANQLTVLPDTFGNLTQLKILYLSYNKLTALPNSFGNLINLHELHLSRNQLQVLPDTFGKLNNLNALYIDNNQLKQLPDTFGNLNSLNALYINNNQLSVLPGTFGNLNNLNALYINNNQLNVLPDFFGSLTQLQILSLRSNELTQLPVYLENLKELRILDLGQNQLTVLPDAFGNLTQLNQLSLKGNQLTVLPDAFGNLINLHELYLNNNQLSVLPGSLQKLTKLKVFSVIYNPLLNPNANLYNTDILVTSDNLKLKPLPRQEYVRQHSLNSTFNYDFNREIFEIKRPDNATTYIHSYQRYPTILFIQKLGELTLPQPVPVCLDLSGREIAWHAYSEDKMIITN